MPQVDLSQAVEGLEPAAGTVGGGSALAASDSAAVNVALLALALAVCFFGYKLVKVWITVLGGLVGLVLSIPIGGWLFDLAGRPEGGLGVALGVAALAVCVAGCVFLAFKVYRVGVFFLCGMIPGVTVLLLTLNLDYGWVLALIAFVAFGILGEVLTRPYLIAITALGYGVAAGQIALALLGVEQPVLAALAGLVLAALGFVFQWKTTGDDSEQEN